MGKERGLLCLALNTNTNTNTAPFMPCSKLVQMLLDLYPQGALKSDPYDALERACMIWMRVDAQSRWFLCNTCDTNESTSSGARKRAEHTNTNDLKHEDKNKKEESWKLVHMILEARWKCYNDNDTTNHHDKLIAANLFSPLHVVMRNENIHVIIYSGMLRAILQRYTKHLYQLDPISGQTPLHVLLESVSTKTLLGPAVLRTVIVELLSITNHCTTCTIFTSSDSAGKNKSSSIVVNVASVRNRQGQLPLECALRRGLMWRDGIDLLAQAYPEGIGMQCQSIMSGSSDNSSKDDHLHEHVVVFPFILAAEIGSNVCNVETVYRLLKEDPDVLRTCCPCLC
uniref:Uncharacterized protein n=1 Tax=Leptocylindrus danicus TaxID=163516 RepID=A0A7S2PKA7_9STRA|mmetsp:Transcript_4196/g.6126  ORF Transcript_4196/g.6126 Transcript_4196/m.6126 type:complete len:341 (+) Transcript_4196:753-1775(+)